MNFQILIIFTIYTLTLIKSSWLSRCTINSVSFTNQTYTGYIGENVLQQSTAAASSSLVYSNDTMNNKWRRNTKSDQKSTKSYIRFVDYVKPAVLVGVNEPQCCGQVSLEQLGLSIGPAPDYYESSAVDSTFQLDAESYLCTAQGHECTCYFKIQLVADLNREAVEMYKFQLGAGLSSSTALVTVQVLDDNDLEPMFEPSEYELELVKYTLDEETKEPRVINYVPFTPITRLVAFDPDLDRNSISRYYLKNPSTRFLLDWYSGELYLKRRPTSGDFDRQLVQLEVKAIDAGLKYSLLNSVIKYANANRPIDTHVQLIQTAARLNLNASLVRQLPKLNSFESGQVKLTMRDNLAQLADLIRPHVRLVDAPMDASQSVAASIPYKLIRIDAHHFRNVRLRLDAHRFTLVRTNDAYTVNVRLDDSDAPLRDVNVTVDLVAPDDHFTPLVTIHFRASDVYTRLCTCHVRASEARIKLHRFNVQPNLAHVKVAFAHGWHSFCSKMAANRLNFTTNHTAFHVLTDGLLKLLDRSALRKHLTLQLNAQLMRN